MRRKIPAAVLLLAMLLSLASCGGGSAGGETKDPGGEASQPVGGAEQTKAPEGDGPQPTEGPETAEPRYIFSDRPVAAFEVTGLDLHSIYDGPYTDVEGYSYDLPIVKLTPGENPFIIFCMPGEDEGDFTVSAAAIHSPAGSGQWEGRLYRCFDTIVDPVPEGYTLLERPDYIYTEADYGGEFDSLLDEWLDWIMFTELYHPDAAQDDSIYVIEVIPHSFDEAFDTFDECLVELVNSFDLLGAAATQISVDEALARCRIEVSK